MAKYVPRTWCVGDLTISLDDVLLNKIDYPLNLKNFLDFCRFEHNEENVNCWLEINDWKSMFDKMEEGDVVQTAQDIIGKYIGVNATVAQVNIAEVTSQSLYIIDDGEQKSQEIYRSRFDAAMLEIEDIIHRDIFPRFIQKVRGEVDNLRARKLAMWWLHLREMKSPADLFTFPAFINEAESRLHAYVATTQMIIFLIIGWLTPYWQCYYLVLYGYTTRVIAGPRFCPSAWLVLFVLYPIANKYKLFKNEMVPSSPKRFAQAIGIVFSLSYVVLMYFFPLAARIISIVHIAVSFLAAATGFCLGCYTYHYIEALQFRSPSFIRSRSASGKNHSRVHCISIQKSVSMESPEALATDRDLLPTATRGEDEEEGLTGTMMMSGKFTTLPMAAAIKVLEEEEAEHSRPIAVPVPVPVQVSASGKKTILLPQEYDC